MLARGVLVGSVMLLYSLPVLAQPAPPSVVETRAEPWKTGISAENQRKANDLLEAGNELFLQRKFLDALDTYRKALGLWDHPALHYDIARCLLELDRPIEATESLERALKYGKAPFDNAQLYLDALQYQKLLANQIGEIVVRCSDPDIAIAIDGRAVANCLAPPTRVPPGEHFIVGSKRGYFTETKKVSVFGGKRVEVKLASVPLDEAGEEVHRWPVALPLAVLGTGAAVGTIGGLLRWQATNDMATYDAGIRTGCRTTGCPIDTVNEAIKRRAILENRLAIGVAAVGVATLITGGLLLYMNRGQRVYPVIESAPGGASIGVRAAF